MKYSRRDWLKKTLLAAATAPILRAGLPESSGQKFRVGYQLLSWGRYYPLSWWEGCREVAALGFSGVEGEATIADLYEGRREEFFTKMKHFGVKLAALYSSSDLERTGEVYQNFSENLKAAEFLEAAGARVLVIGGSESPPATDEAIRRLAGAANDLGRRVLERYRVKVGFHPHVGSLIQHREDIGRLMEWTDPRYFFLAPDTGHLAAGGSDPVEVFRAYGKRIVHTHFKDFDPKLPGFGGRRGRMAPLGQGSVDFPALVDILREIGYDGWIDVEFDGITAPRETAETNRRYLVEKLKLEL